MVAEVSKSMQMRYLPQYQQFKVKLEQRGAGYFGATKNDLGIGSAWALPISEHCLVVGHDLIPAHDVDLLELTPSPYACVTELSVATAKVMPEINIRPHALTTSTTQLKMPAFTFMTEEIGEDISKLKAGMRYYTRAILFEPGYFRELERAYPTQFAGLFESFGSSWDEDAARALCTGLHQIAPERMMAPGAHLHAKSVIGTMISQLACENAADAYAEKASGTNRQAVLVHSIIALASRELDHGHQLSLDEAASLLYVSRSTLCAAFKQETGESLGAYLRRRRAERAEELLVDSRLSIAEIAQALGYPRQSAFSQAFKQTHGMSPTEFRNLR